jgi:hypothetical protein
MGLPQVAELGDGPLPMDGNCEYIEKDAVVLQLVFSVRGLTALHFKEQTCYKTFIYLGL